MVDLVHCTQRKKLRIAHDPKTDDYELVGKTEYGKPFYKYLIEDKVSLLSKVLPINDVESTDITVLFQQWKIEKLVGN